MIRFALPALAALGFIAFAAQTRATPPAAGGEPAMGWHLSQEGATAKLAYGVADSDQLALMLTCQPGQGAAVVYGDVAPARARLSHAALASAPIDPLSGDLDEESRIGLRDPALTGLVRTGRMPVIGEAGTFDLTATPAERRAIGEFIAYCGSSTA